MNKLDLVNGVTVTQFGAQNCNLLRSTGYVQKEAMLKSATSAEFSCGSRSVACPATSSAMTNG